VALQRSRRLRFGGFEADLRTGQLSKRGKRLTLQEQPFRLLLILLEKPGELVTREELHRQLWPQTTIDFDHGLNKAVSKIREALGDSVENPRFVETVARRGYRFLADVTAVDEHQRLIEPAREVIPADAQLPAGPHAFVSLLSSRSALRLPILVSALVLAALAAWALYPSPHDERPIRSLAVLPLENLSGDPAQEYFADGMTEELITDLGQIGTLRVISRTSAMMYKGARKPVAEIGRQLDVDAVIEGSVMRSGERVRITAQLIDVAADKHMWAQSYEGNIRDTLALQGRVARDIAEHIRVTLDRPQQAALTTSRAVNPEAYEAYLKGRYFWNKRTGDGLKKAIEYFNHAIELDSTYAEAYSGLADAYALAGDWEYGVLSPQEAFAKAKVAATRALQLDDNLAEAHTSLALALDLYGWEWEAAEQQYRRAIALRPSYATAHLWYGWHLLLTGRDSEGIAELRNAESLDPLSLIVSADLADALCIAHRYDASIQQSRKALDLDPNFALAHYELGQALTQKHMYGEALFEFQRAIEIAGHNGAFDSNLAYVYAVTGRQEDAMKIAGNMAKHDENPTADANIALIYVGLRDFPQAMTWLTKAYEARFNPSILLRPGFDPLRSDARFTALWHRMGLGE
jgi:TolB-like protein/DNA-binding winged helix-turn-helix (wHTH) protein/Flp pilus assembly protein TadD